MTAQRMLFMMMAALILTSIWLTGFEVVHWFLYVPLAALLFGGITGVCPGLILLRKMGFK